jgi:hypothetical protein
MLGIQATNTQRSSIIYVVKIYRSDVNGGRCGDIHDVIDLVEYHNRSTRLQQALEAR